MEEKIEIWKNIKDFENLYLISNFGRIKSINRNIILKQSIDRYGYYKLSLNKLNKPYYFTTHRLVALNFIPNIDKLPQVNHIDGNKLNNNVKNLEWTSVSDNLKHAFKIGLKNQNGERNHKSTLTKDDVLTIRDLYKNTNITHQKLSEMYNVSRRHIGNIIQRKLWKHI